MEESQYQLEPLDASVVLETSELKLSAQTEGSGDESDGHT